MLGISPLCPFSVFFFLIEILRISIFLNKSYLEFKKKTTFVFRPLFSHTFLNFILTDSSEGRNYNRIHLC